MYTEKFASRIIITAVVCALIFSPLSLTAAASNPNGYSWYCKRTSDHSQPPLPTEFGFITNANGYYLGDDPDEKVIYLTFDAGYENGNVAKIVDILNQNEVTGAFFILSNLINTDPMLVQKMADSGHTVCNHTSKHKDMSKVGDYDSFKNELTALEDLYREKIGGEVAKYFRPPEGRFSEETLLYAKRMGYKTIFWSFAYADWDNGNQMSESAAIEKIMKNIHNGAVVLLHPTSDTNAAILDRVIKKLKDMGYRFGTLDELTRNG